MVNVPLTKEQAKTNLKKILDKYNKFKDSDELKEEANAEKIIEEIFEDVLGWESLEDYIKRKVQKTGKFPDYTFRLNGINKFYLEAKKLSATLDNVTFQKQAIGYARSSSVSFAVLTNFEEIRVYVVDRETNKLSNYEKVQLFRPIKIINALNDSEFEKLNLLSKESFTNKRIYEYAEETCKLPKRKDVDLHLSITLNKLREKLKNSIKKNQKNNKFIEDTSKSVLDEVVQRILDRLVFIRFCEDKEFENMLLGALANSYKESGLKLWKELRGLFRDYDKKNERTNVGGYDSGLFEVSLCDELEIEDETIYQLIIELSYFEDGTPINFSKIPADVLGNLYEGYLSHISKNVDAQKTQRKKQGIYYTPTYIVDYIVKNTVGELLKNKKINPEKIRILDPACGSGSFLIKTFDVINEFYKKKKNEEQTELDASGFGETYTRKTKIVLNNIYGVDLDQKAVEIAQLNMLLKIAQKGQRLPQLKKNIKWGNSLIDEEEIDNLTWFKWEEQFSDIIKYDEKGNLKEGYGFDVVIGNPPWSSKIPSEQNKFFAKRYNLSEKNINLCASFIMAGLDKVKFKGYFAFLLPKVVIKNDAYSKVRERILKEYTLIEIADFGVFPNVTSDTVCIIVQKNKSKVLTKIKFFEKELLKKENKLEQSLFSKTNIFSLELNKETNNLLRKIESNSSELCVLFKIKRGIELGQRANLVQCIKCGTYNESNLKYYSSINKSCKKCNTKLNLKENVLQISSKEKKGNYSIPCISGTQISKYSVNDNYFIIQNLKGIDYKEDAFSDKKILIKRIATDIEGTYSNNKLLAFNTVYSIYGVESEKFYKYVLGILNSKLLKFYYEFSYNIGMNLTTQITIENLSKIPIRINKNMEELVVQKVSKIIQLSDELNTYETKTSVFEKVEEEIKKINYEINELVFKIYGITKEEQKIIEESLK